MHQKIGSKNISIKLCVAIDWITVVRIVKRKYVSSCSTQNMFHLTIVIFKALSFLAGQACNRKIVILFWIIHKKYIIRYWFACFSIYFCIRLDISCCFFFFLLDVVCSCGSLFIVFVISLVVRVTWITIWRQIYFHSINHSMVVSFLIVFRVFCVLLFVLWL